MRIFWIGIGGVVKSTIGNKLSNLLVYWVRFSFTSKALPLYLSLFLICLFQISIAKNTFAESHNESYFDNYSISVGIEHKIMVLMIERNRDNAEAEFKQDVFAPSLSFNTPTGFFGDTNFGVNVYFKLIQFKLTEQQTSYEGANQSKDIGTYIEGTFYYLIPTFFYIIGNINSDFFLKLGAGFGISGAVFDGNVAFNARLKRDSNGNLVLDTDQESRQDVSFTEMNKRANSFIVEAKLGPIIVGFDKRSPKFKEDDYDYILNDISIYAMYAFLF